MYIFNLPHKFLISFAFLHSVHAQLQLRGVDFMLCQTLSYAEINNASVHHVHLPPHVWKGLWHPQESFKVKYCTTVACCRFF